MQNNRLASADQNIFYLFNKFGEKGSTVEYTHCGQTDKLTFSESGATNFKQISFAKKKKKTHHKRTALTAPPFWESCLFIVYSYISAGRAEGGPSWPWISCSNTPRHKHHFSPGNLSCSNSRQKATRKLHTKESTPSIDVVLHCTVSREAEKPQQNHWTVRGTPLTINGPSLNPHLGLSHTRGTQPLVHTPWWTPLTLHKTAGTWHRLSLCHRECLRWLKLNQSSHGPLCLMSPRETCGADNSGLNDGLAFTAGRGDQFNPGISDDWGLKRFGCDGWNRKQVSRQNKTAWTLLRSDLSALRVWCVSPGSLLCSFKPPKCALKEQCLLRF